MTLTELQQEVYTLTNRPDLVAETLSAVRSATLKLHQMEYWYKDIKETGISFLSAAYLQQIEYRALFSRWRALKYLRKTDVNLEQDGAFFKVLSVPEMVEDDYQLNRNDVCYVAGSVIQIRSSAQFQYAILGYYESPNITAGSYSSWIALDHPYAIIFEAVAKVFKMVGDTDQFTAYTRLAQEERITLQTSNIQAIGY